MKFPKSVLVLTAGLFAAVVLAASPAEAKPAKNFNDAQLKLLFSGSKIEATGQAICRTYPAVGDVSLKFDFAADGTFTVEYNCSTTFFTTPYDDGSDTGKWLVEVSKLCLEFSNPDTATYFPSHKNCWPVRHGKFEFGFFEGNKAFWDLSVSHPKFSSKKKLLAALEKISTPSAPAAVATAGDLTLAPAEYKSLPVGTKVRYDNWSYTVQRTDGFETIVKESKNGKWPKIYAGFGWQGDDNYTLRVTYAWDSYTWTTEFDDRNKKALEKLWPLKVGNKTKLSFGEEFAGMYGGNATRTWNMTVEVVDTENLRLGKLVYPTFVVRVHVSSEAPALPLYDFPEQEYTETYWYNPDSGLPLKFVRIWIRGGQADASDQHTLEHVSYPKGTTTHALKGTKPGIGGAADKVLLAQVEKLKQQAEQARQAEAARKARQAGAEKARQAEIARLKQQAEEARRAVAVRKAEDSEADKARDAEIARLRRQVEERGRADEVLKARKGEEEKARRAEMARLKQEAEEARRSVATRKAREGEEDKTRQSEIARLKKEIEGQRRAKAQLTERESQEIKAREAEVARLRQEARERQQAEAARKAREAKEEKSRVAEMARLKLEAGEARRAEAARKAREAEEDKARTAEMARLKRDAEEAKKARAAEIAQLKQQAEEAEKARRAEVARLKREAAEFQKALARRNAQEAEEEKARQAEIARLKQEAGEFQKALARRDALEAREEKAREAEMARLKKESEKADKARQAEIASLRRELEKARQAREAEAEAEKADEGFEGIQFGRYHALVIGIQKYRYLPKLKTSVKDAKAVARVLIEEYGFRVRLMIDPTHGEIIDALDEYREILNGKDNLLIYYAGHGWLDEDADRGYWLPVDAKPNRRSRWVSNAIITDTLKSLAAKHVMVVADSCYSGTLVRSATAMGPRRRTGDYWKQMAEKWARVAITSGGIEPVADKGGGGHSPFAKAFIDALEDNNTVMDGTTLFSKMRRPVMVASQQTPQYSDVRGAGHDGGDFLFVRK